MLLRTASLVFLTKNMKRLLVTLQKIVLPILLTAWFPYRFYADIAHYQSHSQDILTLFIEFVCLIFCAVMIFQSCRNHEWITVALYCITALSALFFTYCIGQIPFCTECDHIARSDLHPILKPFEETFAPFWGE